MSWMNSGPPPPAGIDLSDSDLSSDDEEDNITLGELRRLRGREQLQYDDDTGDDSSMRSPTPMRLPTPMGSADSNNGITFSPSEFQPPQQRTNVANQMRDMREQESRNKRQREEESEIQEFEHRHRLPAGGVRGAVYRPNYDHTAIPDTDPYMSLRVIVNAKGAQKSVERRVKQIPNIHTRVLRQLHFEDIRDLGYVNHDRDTMTIADVGNDIQRSAQQIAVSMLDGAGGYGGAESTHERQTNTPWGATGAGEDRRFDWMVTIWDEEWTPDYLDLIDAYQHIAYAIMQQEVGGQNGGIHWQCYVEFTRFVDRTFITRILKTGKFHAEPRRMGRTSCRNYCMKHLSRVPGACPIEYGEFKNTQGHRSDMDRVVSMISSGASANVIYENCPTMMIRMGNNIRNTLALRDRAKQPTMRNVDVTLFVGTTGTGKTYQAVDMYPDAYIATAQGGGPAKGTIWFDGYDGQDVVIFDDYHSWLATEVFLTMMDRYKVQVPVKGGMAPAMWTKIIITSNMLPTQWVDGATKRKPSKVHLAAMLRRIHNMYMVLNEDRDNNGVPMMLILKHRGTCTRLGKKMELDFKCEDDMDCMLPRGDQITALLSYD